ncbi:3-dehydroquinate synthase [Pontibacillus sp. ALD_SL1]|uniref:3-dehydroquinate synthase II n=1 Tax=Pontibacillus sp. ALD_SL1 TaxID=2777185 RepID=UPI001A979A03|nr:3-dehydroquinate synthase II [Pontibacillus sp. ALD_SL1]QSS99714.1 3-dehydroquinate synthase [Pontibacillus sp. ALD_SL1]
MKGQTQYFEVTKIIEVGEGMRVCLDFTDILAPAEGLFVGNTGHGYVHVLSENRETGDYPARPFRINCGAFHQYLHQGDRMLYLHEVTPGEPLTLSSLEVEIDRYVGRVKIEKRPFVRVECEGQDGMISATLQNSSSVFVREESEGELSVQDLTVGQRILCLPDEPGRHLGERIEETIFEK